MTTTTRPSEHTGTPQVMYLALEMGQAQWKIGTTTSASARPRTKTIVAGDLAALAREIEAAQARWGLVGAQVYSCYEAGRDGFWVHRWLTAHGVINVVLDASSIEVPRRARRAKTDRLDLGGLLSLLIRRVAGDQRCARVVRVPTVAEEDARQVGRALATAQTERTRQRNRLHALLAAMGVRLPLTGDFPTALAAVPLWDGTAMPAGVIARAEAEWTRLQLVETQIRTLEARRRAQAADVTAVSHAHVQQLAGLRALGLTGATTFVYEVFGWRQLRNRREVGALFGLTPTPWASGTLVREQGISKTGNRQIRALAIEIAWGWLRWQPTSALSQWYADHYGRGNSRHRRIGIVAVARRLMIALWRYLETGEIPAGATLKPVEA